MTNQAKIENRDNKTMVVPIQKKLTLHFLLTMVSKGDRGT